MILYILDSTCKCNRRLTKEFLKRCFEIKALSRTPIEFLHHEIYFFVVDRYKIGVFREILAHQVFHVFVGPSFPSCIWMGEVEIGCQVLPNVFMVSKFLALIGRNRVDRSIQRVEQMEAGVLDNLASPSTNFTEHGQASFTFREAEQGILLSLRDDGIDFPVAQTLTLVNNLWTRIDTNPIGQFSPAVVAGVTLTAFLLTA